MILTHKLTTKPNPQDPTTLGALFEFSINGDRAFDLAMLVADQNTVLHVAAAIVGIERMLKGVTHG